MFRKQLAAALAALLAVAACAPCASAQSGRRFPKSGAEKAFIALADEKSDAVSEGAGEARARRVGGKDDKGFDPRGLNAGRSAPAVFAEGGDKHPNKADKIAGAALLGYLIIALVVMATSDDPYAPSGGFARGAGLRR
jgi:hypothetical protein